MWQFLKTTSGRIRNERPAVFLCTLIYLERAIPDCDAGLTSPQVVILHSKLNYRRIPKRSLGLQLKGSPKSVDPVRGFVFSFLECRAGPYNF